MIGLLPVKGGAGSAGTATMETQVGRGDGVAAVKALDLALARPR